MSKQQTATDWLWEQIVNKGRTDYVELLQEADLLHQKQIIQAHFVATKKMTECINEIYPVPKSLHVLKMIEEGKETHEIGEEYYNETYGQTENATAGADQHQ